MDKHGKLKQVLFENVLMANNLTGEMEISKQSFQLWTERDLEDFIGKIPGVSYVSPQYADINGSYGITIDPRYDVEFVKKEIEA